MGPSTQKPNPTLFFQAAGGFQLSGCIRAAIELDLFTAIGEGNTTAVQIAKRCRASERGTRMLCDYPAAAKFLDKNDDRYSLTEDSAAYLDRRSPGYIGSSVYFMTSPMLMDAFRDVAAAVRKGGTLFAGDGSVEADNPVWVEFARHMMPLTVQPAEIIASLLEADSGEKWKVLDIAAGHGNFGITLARRNQDAEVVALDSPKVLEVARENAERAGVGSRFRELPGSAFETEFGTGYDVVLLTNFLHHFDPPQCEGLLRKIHGAMNPGGRLVTVEFVPNEDRVSPPPAAMFSMVMLVTTPGGDAYTFPELDSMFRRAGFGQTTLHELPARLNSVLVTLK